MLLKAKCDVFEAILTRRAVRAFLPTLVDRGTVEHILELAARAPSGSNIQQWKVWVVAGEARQRLCDRIMAAHDSDAPGYEEEYDYYPRQWAEPYLSRRRELGKALYGLAGVPKGDVAATKRQQGRNYIFFGAPVGMFITIERQMPQGSWFDTGTFLQSILLAARGFGLDTCPQQAFTKYNRLIRQELGIPESEVIACGLALGHAAPDAPENRLVTPREPVSHFSTIYWD